MRSKRKSNFELMRIIAMLFIILWHILVHGHVMDNCANTNLTFLLEIVKFLIVVHVNLFVLLTGYFQCKGKFHFSKITKIFAQCMAYCLGTVFVLSCLNIIDVNMIDVFKSIFVDFLGQYWFINIYILLYLISPLINRVIRDFSNLDFIKWLSVLILVFCVFPFIFGNTYFFTNSGFTLINFIIIYIIGAYLRLYPIKESYLFRRFTNEGYKFSMIVIYLSCALINYMLYKTSVSIVNTNDFTRYMSNNVIQEIFHYENPLIIIQSVAAFLYFEKISVTSRVINKISQFTFGIYMFHENKYIQPRIFKWLGIDNGVIYSFNFIFYIILITFLIFILGSLIEFARQVIFKFVANRKVSIRFRNNIKNHIEKLGIVVNW